ncbi:DUF6492 family protein [Paenibacillus sp. GD4]|uniref:DUF6492 family protein n=1 Tax=Paenibacillus sp. GD4 TaxID=3068890 RepID=UPI00358F97E6
MDSRCSVHSGGKAAIDVFIPAIDKDLPTLPYVIDAVRKYVRHPIGKIHIVAPMSKQIRALCAKKGCKFVHEHRVLPIRKSYIDYRSRTWDRSGWLYQQLLKLNGDTICKRDFLVVDADTVFIRPHRFRIGGKAVFYCRDWSQPEYFTTYQKLLGRKKAAPRSFVTHYMLFEREKLRELKRKIESRHGQVWYKAIIQSINRRKQFGFSEFETYGNYVYEKNPSQCVLKSARNKSLSTSAAGLSDKRRKRLAATYRSLSFHQRKIYRRASKSPGT